jgi:hypothetical protein
MHSPSRPASPRHLHELPRWIRGIDAATVVVALLAACVYAFGGFREQLGPLRVSVRSWERLLIASLILTAVRHMLVPRPWAGRVVSTALTRWWQSDVTRATWPAFVATRLGVLLVAWLGVITTGVPAELERFRVSEDLLANLLARWDAQWYLGIAQEGYQWDGNPRREQNVVFFPAFPLSMRVVGWFFGRRPLEAGLLLSLGAFLLALRYLYRLGRELIDEPRAQAAVWLLAAYPFAVYYSAPYTESYYLLGAVAVFFHAHREEYGRAALWAVFLSLCRPNGFFMAAPLAVLALQRQLAVGRLAWPSWGVAMAPAAGVLLYSGYLYAAFGDPLAWLKGQAAWGRVFVGVTDGVRALVADRYAWLANEGFIRYVTLNPYDFMYTAAALFVLVAIWPCSRRFGFAYGAFILVNIGPPLVMGGMMSIGRMTSVLFPAFLWLGAATPARHVPALIAVFCMLQGLVAILFFTWRPVF